MLDDIVQRILGEIFHCKLLRGFAQLPRKPPLLDHIIVSQASVWPIRNVLGPPSDDYCSVVTSLRIGVTVL